MGPLPGLNADISSMLTRPHQGRHRLPDVPAGVDRGNIPATSEAPTSLTFRGQYKTSKFKGAW